MMDRNRNLLIAILVLVIGGLTACIRSHTLKPESAWAAPEVASKAGETLRFSVTDRTFFDHGKLRESSRNLQYLFEGLGAQPWVDPATREKVKVGTWQKLKESFSEEARDVDAMKPPAQGLYLRVHNEHIKVSQGARHWSSVAMFTLYVLPAYIGSGGFATDIDVFRDGRKLKSYHYRVEKSAFFWLPLIVVTWVNAITTSESDAQEAIVRDVMADLVRNNYFR